MLAIGSTHELAGRLQYHPILLYSRSISGDRLFSDLVVYLAESVPMLGRNQSAAAATKGSVEHARQHPRPTARID
jgi:hypothetical protein